MTTADAAEFKRLMFRLDTVFDKASSVARTDAYFEELRDIPIGLVSGAVDLHCKRARTYPRPAELRKLADEAIEKAPPLALPPADIDGEPTYHCTACRDTGWVEQGEHRTPPTVKVCSCVKTNPTFEKTRKRYGYRDSDFSRSW